MDFRYFLIKKITTYRIFLYNFQAFHLCEKIRAFLLLKKSLHSKTHTHIIYSFNKFISLLSIYKICYICIGSNEELVDIFLFPLIILLIILFNLRLIINI